MPSPGFPFQQRGARPSEMRAGVLVLLIGLAVAAIVYLATGGHLIFLPLLFLPFVVFRPRDHGRQRRL